MTASLLNMLVCAVTLAMMAGCNHARDDRPVNRNLPTMSMPIGSETFTLEIAADDKTREIGLMNRESMPENHGMIFVFPQEQMMGFWMKSTYIPLDLIYVGADRRIVSIHSMRPLDLTTAVSAAPAQYAIELNAGAAARAGVKPGDTLEIPPTLSTDR